MNGDTANIRGIILYDYLFCRGGAERVTLELADDLEADLCCGFRDITAFPAEDLSHLRCIELRSRPFRCHRLHLFFYMWLFWRNTHFLRHYQWVIYSGSSAPLAVSRHSRGPNICYCHTLPRFAYDLFEHFLNNLDMKRRLFFRGLVCLTRFFYARAMRRMDVVVANSANVQARLRRYLGIEAQIVYPPCAVDAFRWLGQGDYFLSTARIEPLKRVEALVLAFMAMPEKKLVVTSGGSEFERLRRLAAGCGNISFTGWLSDAEMHETVGRALATVYIPRDEDFGMSPVESMAAGKPVIGVAEGGLMETVLNGETGILLPAEPTVEQIQAAVRSMTRERTLAMRPACEQQAKKFSRQRFFTAMRRLLVAHGVDIA